MKGLITSGGLPLVSTGITPSYDQVRPLGGHWFQAQSQSRRLSTLQRSPLHFYTAQVGSTNDFILAFQSYLYKSFLKQPFLSGSLRRWCPDYLGQNHQSTS